MPIITSTYSFCTGVPSQKTLSERILKSNIALYPMVTILRIYFVFLDCAPTLHIFVVNNEGSLIIQHLTNESENDY